MLVKALQMEGNGFLRYFGFASGFFFLADPNLLEPLSPAKRNEFQIPSTVRGIVVTKSTGQAQTFKEGVVLVEINGYPVSTVPEAKSRLKRGINRFYIWFRGKFTYLAYRVP